MSNDHSHPLFFLSSLVLYGVLVLLSVVVRHHSGQLRTLEALQIKQPADTAAVMRAVCDLRFRTPAFDWGDSWIAREPRLKQIDSVKVLDAHPECAQFVAVPVERER